MIFICKIKNKAAAIFLAVLCVATAGNGYAHNANPDMEKRVSERKETQKQEDRQTWDDFMKAVKEQETKESTTAEPAHKGLHEQ